MMSCRHAFTARAVHSLAGPIGNDDKRPVFPINTDNLADIGRVSQQGVVRIIGPFKPSCRNNITIGRLAHDIQDAVPYRSERPVNSSKSSQARSRCRSFIANCEDDHLSPMMLARSCRVDIPGAPPEGFAPPCRRGGGVMVELDWDDEDGCTSDECASMLRGYVPGEDLEDEGVYRFHCRTCQLRHRCPAGIRIIEKSRSETWIYRDELRALIEHRVRIWTMRRDDQLGWDPFIGAYLNSPEWTLKNREWERSTFGNIDLLRDWEKAGIIDYGLSDRLYDAYRERRGQGVL